MDLPPDDPTARQEWLDHWAAEQGRKHSRSPRVKLNLALGRAQQAIALRSQRLADRVFDHGIDTSDRPIEPEQGPPGQVHSVPSSWHVLPRALRYLGVSDQDTFVDFGCGKGRVVHQAAKRPFRRVIGVEICPEVAEIARANLAARSRRHRCANVEIVVSDVADYEVPDDVTIAYFFPFKKETFEMVLQNIVDSIDRHPRRVRLINVWPIRLSQILATGRFRILKEQRSRLLDSHLSRATILESLD